MKNKLRVISELADFYKGYEAQNYNLLRQTKPHDKKLIDLQEKNICYLLTKAKGQKILDVACGTGFFFKWYGDRDIYGVDISQDMLKIASAQKLPNIKSLKIADAEKLPFPNCFFDVVISSKFIMHHPNYYKLIKEMARVTKHGGSIVLDLPNKNSVSYLFTKLRIISGKIRHYNFFTEKEIISICRSLNLRLQEKKGTTVLSYKFFPKYLFGWVDALNKLQFLINRFSYVYYVRLSKK